MNGWSVDLVAMLTGRWPASRERLGCISGQPGSVWIHAASLGEARTARALAGLLAPAFVTVDTHNGRVVADSYRPIDHPWTLAPAWAELRPRLLLFVESAWWPGLERLARSSGVPVVAVGVRASRSNLLRYRTLGGPPLYARSAQDAASLAPHAQILGVSGTSKWAPAPRSPLVWDRPFFALACAREGDAEALIRARDTAFPEHALLIAPRQQALKVPRLRPDDRLLTTRGQLADCLEGAEAVMIGGTYDASIGGHSPIEARAAGAAIVHGPHIWANEPDFVDTHLAPSSSDLAAVLKQALAAPRPPPPEPPAFVDTLPQALSPERSPRPWARPLTPFFRRGLRARPCGGKLVAVGSRNARGSGKTSTAAWVARHLGASIVTRGVGRRGRGVGDSAVHGADPWWLGDEGAALALQGFRVRAHPDRARACQGIEGPIVLEDGLAYDSDVRIEAVDARYPNARGALPMGERRHLPPGDLTVLHHVSARFPSPCEGFVARRVPTAWSRSPDKYVAFSGIARPSDFFATVPEAEETRAFPNHAWHTADLLGWAGSRDLVTTDRDWVRLPPAVRERTSWRGIRLDIPGLSL